MKSVIRFDDVQFELKIAHQYTKIIWDIKMLNFEVNNYKFQQICLNKVFVVNQIH